MRVVSGMIRIFLALLMSVSLVSTAFCAQTASLDALKTMSLENLMQVTVYSASKQEEFLADVATAMYVIDRQDIRRSGARTLPDLLRGVPGLHVASIDGHTWEITARGFGGAFANKLLVLMDGRTLYTPMYSGVYWDMQDTLLEDIERIEVIRGPGATIWGANAVNGVINIITRNAFDTVGGYAQAGGGDLDRNSLNGRFGQRLGALSYRVYGKQLERDNFGTTYSDIIGSEENNDSWRTERGGFRLDWDGNTGQKLTLSGDIYQGKAAQLLAFSSDSFQPSDVEYSGGNLQFQWQDEFSEISTVTLSSYLDRSLREDGYGKQARTTWDIALTQTIDLSSLRQKLVWGGGYRYTEDQTAYSSFIPESERFLVLDPMAATEEVVNLFIQDDIELVADRLHLIVGSKFEHNGYTGFEFQPSIRTSWTPTEHQSLWAAVSRAVRTPSRLDSDMLIYFEGDMEYGGTTYPTDVTIAGNSDFKSEELIAYELGYRVEPLAAVSIDLALFYNDYDNLRSGTSSYSPHYNFGPPVTVDYINVDYTTGNEMDGETYGLELSATWQVREDWRLTGSYSWIKLQLDRPADDYDLLLEEVETSVPEHQASLKSSVDLPYDLEWDTSLYYFSSVGEMYKVDPYLRCDMRLGWMPNEKLELSLSVQNLFDDYHREYYSHFGLASGEVPRNWYAELKYRF